MEGRRGSTGADLPSSPLFSHSSSPNLYVEELLQGLVNPGQPPSGDGSVAFQPWSTYGNDPSYEQNNFMGWNAFRPTLDLSSTARSDSHLQSGPFQGCEDYLRTLSQPESNSENAAEAGGSFFYPVGQDNLLGGPNLGPAADSGRHLYAEALNHWASFAGKPYEPFGRTEVFQSTESDRVSPEPCAAESAGAVGNAASVTKPSYSEVIRNQPPGPAHPSASHKPKSGPNTPPGDEAKFPDFPNFQGAHRSHSRKHKSSRSHPVKPKSPGPHGTEKPSPTTVKPNSRMGLDQFEDLAKAKERYKQSVSCDDSSNPQSRKGSLSSVGSGSSGLDDLNLAARPPPTVPTFTADNPVPGVGVDSEDPVCDEPPRDKPETTTCHAASSATVKAKSKTVQKGARPRAASSPASSPESCAPEKAPTTSAAAPTKPAAVDGMKKKAFFDPKRIFDQKVAPKTPNTKSGPSHTKPKDCSAPSPGPDGHIPNNQNHGPTKEKGGSSTNLLNNGKPKSNLYTTNNVHAKPATTHYINNDLRQAAKKQTNTEGRNSPNRSANKSTNTHSHGESPTDPSVDQADAQPEIRPHAGPTGGRRKHDHGGKKSSHEPRPHPKRSRRHREPPEAPYKELLSQLWDWSVWACKGLMQPAKAILLLVLKVALALLAVGLSGIVVALHQLWVWIREKAPFIRSRKKPEENESFDWSNPSSPTRFKPAGLDKNITLPTTGEEAMKRLLACKGKDPYSILGVRVDSTDEEIKRYYRKQAVLVHPDKNKIPGAEEAFKILGHSFDIIGEPEKRSKYDAQRLETQETETAMHEFADLLTKLRSKMQEAVNLMRCEKCGGRHRRVPVDRPWYSARFCDRCNVRHSAKEGDVWAESKVMGFLWHYFACMEGKIYDITEWASCQGENFKHIQANAHHVIYRIATQAGARQRAQSNSGRGNNEADLEDFINHLFHRSGRNDANPADGQQQHAASPTSPAAAAAAAAAKKRRKKKKH